MTDVYAVKDSDRSSIFTNFLHRSCANRARDSTLRAIALSCRKNFHFYFPALLENVTISVTDLISTRSLLQRENYGHLVRSLHVKTLSVEFSETKKSLLANDFIAISGLPSSVNHIIRFEQGFDLTMVSIFRSVPAIETLIIEPPRYINSLFFERHAFLVKSLKKLYISSDPKEGKSNLSVKNGVWLLLFVPQA